MIAVALETSARAASVAVRHGDAVRSLRLESERAHASDLFPSLERLMRELGASPRSIGAVFVGLGPGSYTGLRVGIATALGLARGSGAQALGVPSGETLAFGRLKPGEEGLVLLDARAEELYLAHYRRLADEVEVLRAPCVLRPAALPPIIDLLSPRCPIFGDATVAQAAGLSDADRARLDPTAVADARDLLALGERRLARFGPTPLGELEPLYLRPFAAKPRKR